MGCDMDINPEMQAIVIGPDGLTATGMPTPHPTGAEILIRVRYAALNRADLGMASGHKHGSAGGAGAIAGLEAAGDVVALGPDARGYSIGDRVMCSGAGAYADYMLTSPERTFAIPSSLTYAEAVCLPVALTTMHDAIVTNGRLVPGESILIQGASSGVGIVGLQIAKMLGAGLVMGSSTSSDRRQRLTDYGADAVIDTSDAEWPDAVQELTDGKGVDVIVDQVSASVANDNMKAARVLGRIVNVGRLGGTHGDFNFDLHALKRIQYTGVTFRTRSRFEVSQIRDAMLKDLGDRLADFRIPVDRTFPLAEAAAAQAYMGDNLHFGKILLEVGSN